MNKFAVAILLWIAFAALAIAGNTAVYYGSVYQVDRANSWVDLAATSNDLRVTLSDLNETLSLLAPYHGNPVPGWAAPQPRTDFDNIRLQIEGTIQTGIQVLNQTPDSFTYQTALHNIQSDLTTTLSGELNDVAGAIWFWSSGGWTLWGIVASTVLTVVIGLWPDSRYR